MIIFKEKNLRSINNFINLSFLVTNILCTYLFVSISTHRGIYASVLSMSGTFFGFLPIYYFYKQFSGKEKYINILPVSMKKMYLTTFIDWFIAYIINNLIMAIMLNKINLGYEILLFNPSIIILNPSIIPTLNEILSFSRINLVIISGIILAKFYNINWILVLGVFIGIDKTIEILVRYFFIEKQDFTTGFFDMSLNSSYSIMNILIFILASIVFLFMSTKLDKLSIE